MPQSRYFYSDTISDFLKKSDNEIIGLLSREGATYSINLETEFAWQEEIRVMKDTLADYSDRGSIFFEYNIPRMGRRADVIAVIDGIVFILEFKAGSKEFIRAGFIQVWDYALDMKNFQEGSLDRTIAPILVCSNAPDKSCTTMLLPYADGVYTPICSNAEKLKDFIGQIIKNEGGEKTFGTNEDLAWSRSGYSPTPTIIEAAIALYNNHTVEEITRHDGEIDVASSCVDQIIKHCMDNNRKAICFVTGVPGAGKTLIGLQTAIRQFEEDQKAVYLSGNFPLVEVLQESLARDFVRRQKANGTKCNKAEARSKVKAFVQMIHHYRDTYLEGTKVEGGRIVPIEGYFRSHTDKAYIPAEHVAIFDEAQRAWTRNELARFMREKKQIKDFPYSEPEYLISCMDRQVDWGVVICLVGGGQEINKGEAGMKEWIDSLNRSFPHWEVYMSDKLKDKEYAQGEALKLVNEQQRLHVEPSLHLPVSMRSFRAELLSTFVHQLLELKPQEASETLKQLSKYPIVLTRSLDKAKEWLRAHARGSERYGLLASSKAERLKAISVNVRYQPDFVHWFLEDDSDIRSSNRLEDTLTEFKVQGLEIDWACVVWDADLRLNKAKNAWQHYQLRSGTVWQNINKEENRAYQINAYRVLLTRARQGLVIVVPNGDNGVPPDETRKSEWYDSVYNYLKGIGIQEI